ncbi:SDR family oxidoreductase [Mycobacterium sp. C31M]
MSSERKSIFITGASAGIGKATAKLFGDRGWRVIATMRRPEAAPDVAALPGVEVLTLDVADPSQIESAVAQAVSKGTVDVVLNNAGYAVPGPLEGLSDGQITDNVATNLLGPIRVVKAFIPHFRDNGGGLFINTSSIGGLITVPLSAMYHATKWGLEGWSESMAFELSRVGIGMKILEPGGVNTEFMSRSMEVAAYHPAYGDMLDKFLSGVSDQIQQSSTAEDIAEVAYRAATDGTNQLRYLAGPDAIALHKTRLELGAEQFREVALREFLKKA